MLAAATLEHAYEGTDNEGRITRAKTSSCDIPVGAAPRGVPEGAPTDAGMPIEACVVSKPAILPLFTNAVRVPAEVGVDW